MAKVRKIQHRQLECPRCGQHVWSAQPRRSFVAFRGHPTRQRSIWELRWHYDQDGESCTCTHVGVQP